MTSRRPRRTRFAAFALLLVTAASAEAAPRLVADLGPPDAVAESSLRDVETAAPAVALGDEVVFAATSHLHGEELWASDGTAAGTRLVADLRPGVAGAAPGGFAGFAGAVVFSAEVDGLGRELWASDGTREGTRLVADLCPGPCDGVRRRDARLVAMGGDLFFAGDDGLHGEELWRLSAGGEVELVADLCPGACDACPTLLDATFARVFLVADDGAGSRFLGSDGSAAGTLDLGVDGPDACGGEAAFAEGRAIGDTFFFAATTEAHGREAWASEGTPATTHLVADLCPGACWGLHRFVGALGDRAVFEGKEVDEPPFPRDTDLFAVGDDVAKVLDADPDTLFLAAASYDGALAVLLSRLSGPSADLELWRVADAGATRIEVLERDAAPPNAGWLAVAGDVLYAAARVDDAGDAAVLWRSDGTAAGTRRVRKLPSAPGSRDQPYGTITDLVGFGDRLFFAGRAQATGDEPWTSDGTRDGTRLLADLHDDPGSSRPREITPTATVGDVALLVGEAHAVTILYRTDGTGAGTDSLLALLPPAVELFPFEGGALFGGVGSATGGLWRTDGFDLVRLDPEARAPRGFTAAETGIYFAADGGRGVELWRTDGTTAGTFEVADIDPGFHFEPAPILPPAIPNDSRPSDLVSCPPGVLFAAGDVDAGREPWFSDGTTAGTVRLADVCPGPCSSDPDGTSLAGGVAVFAATSPASGREPWISDATAEGTTLLADLLPGPAGSFPRFFRPDGSRLSFFARGADGGDRLFSTDGTAGGTLLLSPLALAGDPSPVHVLAVAGAGERLFFSAHHPALGVELWSWDGVVAAPVADLYPGPTGAHPTELTPISDGVLFAADAGDGAGRELWRSDGTAAGTRRVSDLAPGPLSAQPEELALFTDERFRLHVRFRADDGVRGLELWQLLLEPKRAPRLPPPPVPVLPLD